MTAYVFDFVSLRCKITVFSAFSAFSAVMEHGLSFFPCSLVFFKVINLGLS